MGVVGFEVRGRKYTRVRTYIRRETPSPMVCRLTFWLSEGQRACEPPDPLQYGCKCHWSWWPKKPYAPSLEFGSWFWPSWNLLSKMIEPSNIPIIFLTYYNKQNQVTSRIICELRPPASFSATVPNWVRRIIEGKASHCISLGFSVLLPRSWNGRLHSLHLAGGVSLPGAALES